MKYSEIYERINLQQMREYIVHGGSLMQISEKDYKERLDCAHKSIMNLLSEKITDPGELDDFSGELLIYISDMEDVYAEIGMRCGAVLAAHLLAEPLI